MLPRAERLTRRRDFGATYRRGRRWEHPLLTLYIRRTAPESPRRLGFSISKKVGKAHERNRMKRRLREAMRQLRTESGFDAVAVARPGGSAASFGELNEALKQLFEQAGVRNGEEQGS
jgi:ribonuclease P protein component